jgi:hypothetical protein
MAALNASLYEDRDAYWGEIVRLIQLPPASRPPTPKAVRDVGSACLGQIIDIAGWQKLMRKYGQDVVETMALGYMLSVFEDWGDLDRERAVRLVDESLRAAQATRAAKGTEQISLDDVDNRLTLMTMGLATDAPQAAAARDYLLQQPAYERIDEFGPLLSQMAAGMAGVKGRHAEAFVELNSYAWKIGLGLGLLDAMGEVPHHDRWAFPEEA